MIPYGRQDIRNEDIAAVVEVLKSDWLTQGPVVPRFETAVADYCGARHAVAANSATSALHLACRALDVGPGDTVWTTPITFVASANCARYCGAHVDFVDVDPATGNLCVNDLERRLAQAESDGTLPKVLIPVHLGGLPCEMPRIGELAARFGFAVIEDASHAIGAHYGSVAVGSCVHSDITVFSFHPVKVMTCGEGGMALTNDPGLARRMQQLRSHGITRDAQELETAPSGGWYYEQQDLGYNYRLSDIHAALGLSQLGRLDEAIARRAVLAAHYDTAFSDLPMSLPARPEGRHSAHHLYAVRLDAAERRADIFQRWRDAGIGVNVHYIPVHLQPYYRRLGFGPGDFPAAEAYYAAAITLPLYPTLTAADQQRVIGTVIATLDNGRPPPNSSRPAAAA